MSSWITLNIEGVSPEQLPETFDDWWVYTENGMAIAYSFNPGMGPEEAAGEAVKAGDDYSSAVDRVLTLRCNDTSDFVDATLYRPREVKWNGVKIIGTWSGHHIFDCEDSEFLQRTRDDFEPVFGGNWKQGFGEGSPAGRLADLREGGENDAR